METNSKNVLQITQTSDFNNKSNVRSVGRRLITHWSGVKRIDLL